jgi:regulator of protease activity HflC (stomatin/prohibitin superfamily)
MESAFAWIGQLVDWVGQFFPRWVIIRATHGGVKFVRGSKIVPLAPGWHLYWPLTTELLTYPTARQAADLRTQTLMTTDGKTLVVGGLIVYEIKDIAAILAHTWDPEQTIKDIALSAIHDVLVRMSWLDIRCDQEHGTLNLKLRKRVRRELDKFGVKVLKTTITDLAQTRVYKLMQSQSQDGI